MAIDINKMTPAQVEQLARMAPARPVGPVNVQFGPNDIFAALGAEALKIVKAGENIALGAPLPDMHVLKAITSRMDAFATILTQMQPPAPKAAPDAMADVLAGITGLPGKVNGANDG